MNFIVCISSSSCSWACGPRPCCCHRPFACRQGSSPPPPPTAPMTPHTHHPTTRHTHSLHPQPSPPAPVSAIQLLHLITRMFSIYTNVHLLYGYAGTKTKQPWCISVREYEYSHTAFWCYLRDVKCVRCLIHSQFSYSCITIVHSYNIWGKHHS